MKRLLLLIIAIVLCNPSSYAIIKRMKVEYKSEGRTYMVVLGNFDKRILVDGEVSITMFNGYGFTNIKGRYEKGEIIGAFRYGDFMDHLQKSVGRKNIYAKMVLSLKIKKGMSLTPRN